MRKVTVTCNLEDYDRFYKYATSTKTNDGLLVRFAPIILSSGFYENLNQEQKDFINQVVEEHTLCVLQQHYDAKLIKQRDK